MRFQHNQTRNMAFDLNEDEIKQAILEYVIRHSRSGQAKEALNAHRWTAKDVELNYDAQVIDDVTVAESWAARVGKAVVLQ